MNTGVIVDLELADYPHGIHRRQCYHALNNILGGVKRIQTLADLDEIALLVIPDDHHEGHKRVFRQDGFIDHANALGITVLVLTTEKIYNSWFYWDIDHYDVIRRFKKLIIHSIECEDSVLLKTPIYRTLFSRHYQDLISIDTNSKKDKIVFMGHTNHIQYNERIRGIDKMSKMFGERFEIVCPVLPTYVDYLKKIAEYRYVFSPMGNGDFFTFRFYEALFAKCIPIHQIRRDTLTFYDVEAQFDDVIYFYDPEEILGKVENCTTPYSHSEFWQEDNMKQLLIHDGLL